MINSRRRPRRMLELKTSDACAVLLPTVLVTAADAVARRVPSEGARGML